VNRRGIVGIALLALGVFLLFGGVGAAVSWVLGYWDRELVDVYRGIEIYHFYNIGPVYGFEWPPGSGDWKYYGSPERCRAAIDDLMEEPIYVESYRGWDIYQKPGSGLYYAVKGEAVTADYDDISALKAYIDILEAGESLEAEVEGRVYTSPGEAEEFPTEVDIAEPGERLSWLRWLGLPLMALGAVLMLRREKA